MPRNVKVVLNKSAVGDLLRLPELQQDLDERARRIAAAAGDGMEASSIIARRARAEVRTATYEAKLAEARTRDLTRAIDAGR